MNSFLLHSLNWFLFPGSRFSFSHTLRSLLFWKRPLYDPHVFELLSHFPPPFTAKYSVPPCLRDSLSHYSSAIWLSLPPPTLTWLCLWSPISNSKDFSWFLSSLPTLQWSVLLAVIFSVKSSPLSHSPLTASLLCCCFSFPVSSLFSKYAYRFHFFLSALWLWTWRGFTMQPIDLLLLLCDLLQVSCLTIIPLSMAPASFFVLTSLASCMNHACSHSLFWPLWLSFGFLKVLGPFWHGIFVIGVV